AGREFRPHGLRVRAVRRGTPARLSTRAGGPLEPSLRHVGARGAGVRRPRRRDDERTTLGEAIALVFGAARVFVVHYSPFTIYHSPIMLTAEIIAVGSELLTPFRTDTNSLWLTDRLNSV